MSELFEKGGPVMWPLLLLSIITVATILDRIIFLFFETKSRQPKLLVELEDLTKNGKLDEAFQVSSRSTDTIARAISGGFKGAGNFDQRVTRTAESEIERFDRGLTLLDTAITLAPLLGLLGTVTGMMRSFKMLGPAELDAPMAITGGIAEALIATAFGLGIAIISLIPFNILRNKKERIVREIEKAANRIEVFFEEKK